MSSTKLELAKEYEKLLNKTRDLNLTNETYLQTIRPPSSASVSSQLSIDSNDDDFDEIENDVIDVNYIDLSDETSWLFKDGDQEAFSEKDIAQFLHQDDEELQDARFQTKRLMLNYDITQVTKLSNNNFVDSRTFTRPKKKMMRPSLESVNSTFKYNYTKNPEEQERLSNSQVESLIAKMKMLSHSETENSEDFNETLVLTETKEQNVQIMYKNPKLEGIIAEQMRKLEDDTPKNSEMTNSIELPIVPKLNSINSLENSIFNTSINFESLNGVDPPSFLMNISFPSANLTSLTTSECDFITTENQPQDLFTSYTSVATNLSEDQHDTVQNEIANETFLTEVQHMSESFLTHVREVDKACVLDTSFDKLVEIDHCDKTIVVDTSLGDKTIVVDTSLGDKTHVVNTSGLRGTSIESSAEKNKSFYNTFTKRSANITKISMSNPNLSEKGLVEFNQLNQSLDSPSKEVAPKLSKLSRLKLSADSLDGESKINSTYNTNQNHRADSLNLSSSFSNVSSNRIAQHTDENEHTELHKISLPKFKSTPIAGSKLNKKVWASTENLSPISLVPPRESSSSEKNRNITKNRGSLTNVFTRSDAKMLNSIETSNRTIKQVDKTETIYKTTENIHALKDPQIPTPMEFRRPPTPVNDVRNSTITVAENKPETTAVRQPIIKSGLPRPTSGIPRLHSRLPIPRSLRPASEHKPPAPPVKNNWMDGCY